MQALAEFARQCGETVPDLMRKLAIRDATLADGYGVDDESYDFRANLSPECGDSSDKRKLEHECNTVRRILGWRQIHL
jgi:hypothetical protein